MPSETDISAKVDNANEGLLPFTEQVGIDVKDDNAHPAALKDAGEQAVRATHELHEGAFHALRSLLYLFKVKSATQKHYKQVRHALHVLQGLGTKIKHTRSIEVLKYNLASYRHVEELMFAKMQKQIAKTLAVRTVFNILPQWAKQKTHGMLDIQLARLFILKSEIAQKSNPDAPYMGMVHEYNPEIEAADLMTMRKDMRIFLQETVQAANKCPAYENPLESQYVPQQVLEKIMYKFAGNISIPRNKIKIYNAASPAALGSPKQVFIANNFKAPAIQFLRDGIHEIFHGHHKLNLPVDDPVLGLPVATAHDEAIAYFGEMLLASPAGIRYTAKLMQNEGFDSDVWSVENLTHYYQKLRLGPRRLENCDTGNLLHMLTLIDIEEKIIEGKADPHSYGVLWREQLSDMLGQGIPEDNFDYALNFHAFVGLPGNVVGYPYGYMGAAQMFEAARQQITDFDMVVESGDWAPIGAWLTDKFHRFGSYKTMQQLYEDATGAPLGIDPMKRVMTSRYLG